MKHFSLSIIIVTYNSQTVLMESLNALGKALKTNTAEIIVIDNASCDRSLNIVHLFQNKKIVNKPYIRIIANKKNLGFTKAINQGLRRAQGRFILLLNPDVIVNNNTISYLLQFIQRNSDIGIVAPQLRYANGEVQPSCRRFPTFGDLLYELTGLARLFPKSKKFNRWKMGDFDHLSTMSVDQPQGAFLLARKKAVDAIGLLDEQFIMFFSDVDWCRRFRENGWKIMFTPEAFALHYKGSSIYQNRIPMLITSHRDFSRYFLKYPNDFRLPLWLIRPIFLLTVWPRILVYIIGKQIEQYRR